MRLINLLKDFLNTAKNPLIVILGPTASGKTALSLKIAKEINGEIISTDSRQIYKEMEISTDSLSKAEQKGIKHHLLGITTPDKSLTVAEYKDLALKEIKAIYARKKVPMLVGGTGLYISAIIEDYDIPRIEPDNALRDKLFKEAEKKGNKHLHEKLRKMDQEAAELIHPNNLRYVIRALEINLSTGKNKHDRKKQKSAFDVLMIGIDRPRNELYERIEERVDLQIKKGLVDEVRNLLKKGYLENLPAMTSLGIKEIIPYIKGKASLEKSIEILKRNTRRYAKRQMTWFRRYDNVHWLTVKEMEKFLKND